MRSVAFLIFWSLTQASLALAYPFTLSRVLYTAAVYTPCTLVILYLLFHPRNQWLVRNRSRVAAGNGRRSVALTFDDGPDPECTPRLLDLLRDKQVRATFFVIGEKVERFPEIVRRARDEGHLVENHTWSHRPMFCFLTPSQLRKEIVRCGEAVRRACGAAPRYFRSPVGLRHLLLESFLRKEGLEYISWRISTYDTLGRNPESAARKILRKVEPGDIVVLHDRSVACAEALPGIIDELKGRGFEFVLVGPADQ